MASRLPTFFLVLLGLAVPAASQLPNPQLLVVESILVEGVRSDAAREIVADQSLLVPGQQYTEEQIRNAVYRIKRLPFVMDADFSLREGQDAGAHQVVIEVEPNRAFFASAEVAGAWNGDAEDGQDRTDWSAALTVGGRLFIGSRGLASASVQGVDGDGPESAQASYTQYGLFGRGASMRLSFNTLLNQDDADFRTGALALEVPIVGDHSVRAIVDWFESRSDDFLFNLRSESRTLGLAWIYDTTDDPLFPTVGSRVTGGARYNRSEVRLRSPFGDGDATSRGIGVDLGGRRHWALTGRQSISTELSASWDQTTSGRLVQNEQSSAGLGLGHSMDLRREGRSKRGADLRWENRLQVLTAHSDSFFGTETTTDARLTTGLALRNSWGLVRLTFSYVDNLQRDFHSDEPFPL